MSKEDYGNIHNKEKKDSPKEKPKTVINIQLQCRVIFLAQINSKKHSSIMKLNLRVVKFWQTFYVFKINKRQNLIFNRIIDMY